MENWKRKKKERESGFPRTFKTEKPQEFLWALKILKTRNILGFPILWEFSRKLKRKNQKKDVKSIWFTFFFLSWKVSNFWIRIRDWEYTFYGKILKTQKSIQPTFCGKFFEKRNWKNRNHKNLYIWFSSEESKKVLGGGVLEVLRLPKSFEDFDEMK